MDVIVTAIGEFIWASSCAAIDFFLGSGLSALIVFVSFLCGILASAFYKYTITRERMLFENPNNSSITTSLCSPVESTDTDLITNEEDIQMEQIRDLYHLLNDVQLTSTEFLEELQLYDETDFRFS